MMINSEGEKIHFPNINKYDYTMIIYWSSFLGGHSVNTLKLESKILENTPKYNIKLIKINMDFREYMKGGTEKIKTPKFRREKGKVVLMNKN